MFSAIASSIKDSLRFALAICVLTALALTFSTMSQAQITPSQDAYTSSAVPTTNYGTAVTLGVSNTATSIQTAYIQFDLSSVPAGYTSANVAKATLKLYVNSVTAAGSFNVDFVNGSWAEKTITHNLAPALGSTITGSVPLTSANVHDYLLIDVTTAVGDWLSGTQANDGIALVANSPLNATFDSKENTSQSQPAELEIVFSGKGTITGVNTASGSGLTGGGTTGTLNLSLLKTCSTKQGLQWNGSAWACSSTGSGTVTQVNTGTGLTGGPITGTGTISIASGGVGTAQIANSAITNPLLASAAVKAGNLSASGSSSGQVLTSNGSSVNWQNPSVPDPLSLNQSSGNATISAVNSGTGVAIYAQSSASDSISASATGSGRGVYAQTSAANQPAIEGYSGASGGVGILGNANGTNAIGMVGQATGTYALWGIEGVFQGFSGIGQSPAAVLGDTNAGQGVMGLSSAGANGSYGVVGVGSNGTAGTGGISDTGYGVYGFSSSTYGVYGRSCGANCPSKTSYSDGVHGDTDSSTGTAVAGINYGGGNGVYGAVYNCSGGPCLAGDFIGNLNVTGQITAGGKDFLIDHPLDPANKYLYHASVESSEMMNIYTGNVTTDAQGEAVVELPDWFEALNKDFRYQLTVIGQFAQAIVSRKISGHQFSIKTDKPSVEVSWQVTGVRQDAYAKAHPLAVEVEKAEKEHGYYLHPEAFGQPQEQGLEFIRHPYQKQQAGDGRKSPDLLKRLRVASAPGSKQSAPAQR